VFALRSGSGDQRVLLQRNGFRLGRRGGSRAASWLTTRARAPIGRRTLQASGYSITSSPEPNDLAPAAPPGVDELPFGAEPMLPGCLMDDRPVT
jgi:hypothetical protein